MYCVKNHKYLLSVAVLLSMLGFSGCEWDSSLYDEMTAALGGNEPESCQNLDYILERGKEPGEITKIKIMCDAGEDGICEPEEVYSLYCTVDQNDQCETETDYESLPPGGANATVDEYRHNFNYAACPNGYSCAQIDGKDRTYCVIKCSKDQHVYAGGCEDNDLANCGKHNNSCESMSGWSNGACVDGTCIPSKCDEDSGYKLSNNKCVPSCEKGMHYDNVTARCEPDDLENCGQMGYACAEKVAYWSDGTCDNGVCKATFCIEGYQVKDNACVASCSNTQYYDTVDGHCKESDLDNCGQKGYACSERVAYWHSGNCTNNICQVQTCQEGYQVKDNACVASCSNTQYYDTVDGHCKESDLDYCGQKGYSCASFITGWETGACNNNTCMASACKSGYSLQDHKCVSTATTCTSTQHYYNGSCEDNSIYNCGGHSIACNSTSNQG